MGKYFNKQKRKELCFNKMGENLGPVQNFINVRFDKTQGKNKYYLEIYVAKYIRNDRQGVFEVKNYSFKVFDTTGELLKIREKILNTENYGILENLVRNLYIKKGVN